MSPPFPPMGGTQDVFFVRSSVGELPTIVSGEGVYLVDDAGRRLLDVCSGPFLANLGQGNERVLAAMVAQGRRLTYTYSRTTRHGANAELSERLAALAGPGFERAHLTSGGSEAVEMAIKLLRAHALATGQPRRHRVISLMPGYHGATLQTLAMNGDIDAPRLWGSLTVASDKIPAPLTFRAPSPETAAAASCEALEHRIAGVGADEVLAVVVEPIGGQASGVNVPHPSFARGVRAICDRYGIHLVFDEVVTAFRTGRFLAAHHDNQAVPDVVVVAKGLGAGYAPLGAVLVSAQLVEEVAATTGFAVSHSYDANPIACAAGAAVLDEVVDRQLIERGELLGGRLRAGLDRIAAASPMVGDVRGRGLLLALELVADKETNARFSQNADPGAIIRRHGLNHGLLLYSRRQNAGRYGDWLLVAPPLVIDEPTCDDLIDRLKTTLGAAEDEVSQCRGGSPDNRVLTASPLRSEPGRTQPVFVRLLVSAENFGVLLAATTSSFPHPGQSFIPTTSRWNPLDRSMCISTKSGSGNLARRLGRRKSGTTPLRRSGHWLFGSRQAFWDTSSARTWSECAARWPRSGARPAARCSIERRAIPHALPAARPDPHPARSRQ